MPHTVPLPVGSRPVLRAAALSALLLGSALPAAAQVLIYEGQPGLAPRGYPVPPGAYPPGTYPGGAYGVPQARYPVLPPEEIRGIVQSLGYWNIGAPKLSGRFYLIAASDQEGRALLRVNAFTGRVVSARTIPGGPAVAAPAPAPQRQAPPATARAVPPAPAPSYSAAPSPSIAGTPAPLPPQRPPEATMAAVTPAPAAVAPAAPVVPTPAPAPAPAPAAATPPAQPAPGASANAPAGQTAAQQSANAAPSATPAQPASPAQPQKRKAGAGTATTDSASAGTASVLSRPKGQ
ncbi:hypothetical protein V5F72_10305 [Xanthobacter flavus]|uniref:hypothetical protein n=1 Tax=Xanthobacter flavus TaxID=281 RepID=UPI00372CD255